MKGENSVERAERMIRDLNMEIEFLRGCAVDARVRCEELEKELAKTKKELEDVEDQKMDALYNKQALMKFIRDGGGLDMYV